MVRKQPTVGVGSSKDYREGAQKRSTEIFSKENDHKKKTEAAVHMYTPVGEKKLRGGGTQWKREAAARWHGEKMALCMVNHRERKTKT